MTRQQQRLCELMLEFHELCEKKDAAYYLIGPQLLHAAKDGKIHGYEMDVAMFLKDWNKIAKWAGKSKRIEVESILDQGKLRGCFYRFVDKNTLLLDLDRYGMLAKPGIGIHVHIIRNQRKKQTLLRFLEKGMDDASVRRRSFAAAVVVPLRAAGREQFAKRVVRLLKTVSTGKTDMESATELREPGDVRCVFEPGYWAGRTTVRLEGMELYAAEGYRSYLTQRYGEGWRRCETDAILEHFRCVFHPSLPYALFLEQVRSRGLLSARFQRQFRRYAKRYEEHQAMREYETLGWEKSIFYAGERIRLWKKYMPLKEKLLSLYGEGRLDEVEMMLSDYLTVLEQYLKMDIVICFDKELLDVVKGLYLTYGRTGLVEKIDACVLPVELEPIVPFWQK